MNNDLISRSALIKSYLGCCRTEFEIRNCCMTDENVIHIISNAPTVEERPKGECKNCKAYRQYGSRADGYCDISRMTAEGMLHINVSEDFYCSYFEEKGEATDNES